MQADKLACHILIDARRRHKTTGSETADGLLLTMIAVARVVPFVQDPRALISTGWHNKGHMTPLYTVVSITGEKTSVSKEWGRQSNGFLKVSIVLIHEHVNILHYIWKRN